MDLSAADSLVLAQPADDRARFRWATGTERGEFELVAAGSGLVSPEFLLCWMLRHGAPVDLVRRSLGAAFPHFDVDAAIEHATIPDRAERSAGDRPRRTVAGMTQRRPFTVTVEHFIDAGERDAEGMYDYYYEGDIYTFENDAEHLRLRTYVDTPAVASTLGLPRAALNRSSLARDAARYLASRGVTIVQGLGRKGTYQRWNPAKSAPDRRP